MDKPRKFSWTDYFSNEDNLSKIQTGTAFYNETGYNNFYIFFCIFEGCKIKGAIYIERTNKICTLLEDSVFNRCSSILDAGGGSVYYRCNNGQFVQQRTCYYKSVARSCMAFKQNVLFDKSFKNYAFDVSISSCGESESKGDCTCFIMLGDIQISDFNSTSNKCIRESSFGSHIVGKSATYNFSTFRGNNQTETNSLYFSIGSYSSETATVSYCNVIGNNCGTDYGSALFHCQGAFYVIHCIFLNNTASYTFYQDRDNSYRFYSLTISNSYVDEQSYIGRVEFKNITENYDFNNFTNFYTENCFIEPKLITIKISYLSKFAKAASTELISSKKIK